MEYTVGQQIVGMAVRADCAGGGYTEVSGIIVSAFNHDGINCYNIINNDQLVTVFEQDVVEVVNG